MASLPTATLANHTTAITGAHPGHSGVLHNAWVDRAPRVHVDLLDLAPDVLGDATTCLRRGDVVRCTRAQPTGFVQLGQLRVLRHRRRPSPPSPWCAGATQSGLPPTNEVRHLDPDAASDGLLQIHVPRGSPQHVPHAAMLGTGAWKCTSGIELVQPGLDRRGRSRERPARTSGPSRGARLRRPDRRGARGRGSAGALHDTACWSWPTTAWSSATLLWTRAGPQR